MPEEKNTSVATEEAMIQEKDSGSESKAISSEETGKVATSNTATTATKAEKIKCDTNTSCDTTLPWGSWES